MKENGKQYSCGRSCVRRNSWIHRLMLRGTPMLFRLFEIVDRVVRQVLDPPAPPVRRVPWVRSPGAASDWPRPRCTM